jgi:D,D-heptose 1,7-bisphosphate phosphatase
MKSRAVFLDRDGTVNVDKDYMYKPEDFEFEKGVAETLKYLYSKNYKLIIITNQSGIARGYYTAEDVERLHDHMRILAKENGFEFTGFYFCPHMPDEGCSCRKPGTALIEKAVLEHGIDLSVSYMVGDKESDMTAGKKAGLTTILVGSGYGKQTKENYDGYDHYFDCITGLMSII